MTDKNISEKSVVADQPADITATPLDTVDSIEPAKEEVEHIEQRVKDGNDISDEQRAKIAKYYGHKASEDNITPANDVTTFIAQKIMEMTNEHAVEILLQAIEYHENDPNFAQETMEKIKLLVPGPKLSELDPSEYDFDLKAEAVIIHYHSPYPEVRSVTEPFDDPNAPFETFRAYFLGLIFMAGCTAINTFFSPRQPSIQIAANVLQLLIWPCGSAWAKIMPDWGVTIHGTRHSLNPGPWSFKEQMFATIIFSIANSAGATYYVYLVQRLPQYLGHTWVRFGYEICLALSTQLFGLGYAGILRRFVIYPHDMIWPKVLPTLALNRALLVPEKKETINGWSISRYRFFFVCFAIMFIYFFIPNFLFSALRSFNWMVRYSFACLLF